MIIDSIKSLELNDELVESYGNELYALEYLSGGLTYLNLITNEYQNKIAKRTGGTMSFSFGHHEALDGIRGLPKELIICGFHWFALSSTNFVQLAGWLGTIDVSESVERRLLISKYVNEVIPNVKAFRDKIAAHFAFSAEDRRNRDSLADKKISSFIPLSISGKVVKVMPLVFHTGSDLEKSESDSLLPWSLTEIYKELCNRYPIFGMHKKRKTSLRETK